MSEKCHTAHSLYKQSIFISVAHINSLATEDPTSHKIQVILVFTSAGGNNIQDFLF